MDGWTDGRTDGRTDTPFHAPSIPEMHFSVREDVPGDVVLGSHLHPNQKLENLVDLGLESWNPLIVELEGMCLQATSLPAFGLPDIDPENERELPGGATVAQQHQEMTLCSFCREPFKTLPTFTGCKHRICSSCSSRFHAGAAGRCPRCCLVPPAGKDGEDEGWMDGEGAGSWPAKPPEEKCREHQEALEVFCTEDRSPVCRRGAELQAHHTHAAVPLEEAAEEYKAKPPLAPAKLEMCPAVDKHEGFLTSVALATSSRMRSHPSLTTFPSPRQTKLEAAVKLLQQQKVEVQSLKSREERKLAEWKNKTSRESEKIEKEFEKLRNFLDEEEEKLQRRLKREKKGTATKLRSNIAQVTKQSQALGELIEEINKKRQQPALRLLKDVEGLLSRSTNIQVRQLAAVPAELQGTYDVPTGGIFEFLNRFKVDVTLDPASAHPSLLLSEDGRSVSHGGTRQDLPDHAERFDPYVFVLGSLRITSGRCYWEVEVGDKTEWDIGVCREAVKRKGKGPLSPPAGFWRMWLRNSNQYKVLLSHPITLSIRAKPKRVGIYLDYKGGEVTFYNATDQTHLYTYGGAFAGVLRPFFSPGLSQGGKNTEPLVVCPAAERE
ncbi:E3 ubiquitin-protein ligase TRIM21-like [Morus bassanus]